MHTSILYLFVMTLDVLECNSILAIRICVEQIKNADIQPMYI